MTVAIEEFLKSKEGISILVVDDVPSARKVLRRLLGALGFFNVAEVASGEDALSNSESSHFDLVISDLHLCDMSGADMIRQMREKDRLDRSHVLIVTSDNSSDAYAQAQNVQVDGYMFKPFGLEDLKNKLFAVLSEEIED